MKANGVIFKAEGSGGGRTNIRTYIRTYGQKIPPVLYRTSSLSGPLPKRICGQSICWSLYLLVHWAMGSLFH